MHEEDRQDAPRLPEEDRALNARVKAAFEEGLAPSPACLANLEAFARRAAVERRRRRLLRWGFSTTLAASLACALAFSVFVAPRPPAPRDAVLNVLALLSAADGLSESEAALTPAEALFAWQEAPCADCL